MTYKIKNATIVFAFAAMLLVMPLTASNVYGDGESSVDPDCGYDIPSNIAMGTIVRGSVGTEAAQTVFTAQETNGLGAAFSVKATTNWVGAGDRASGTITLVDIANTETVTVGTNAYEGKTSGASGGQEFNISTTSTADQDDAEAIALLINALDTTVRATTSGTSVITILAETRGSAGDSIALATTSGTSSVSAANLANGGDNIADHLLADATAVNVKVDESASDTGVAFASKIQMNLINVDKEIAGLTVFDKDIHATFQTSAEYLVAATGTVTFSSVATGDDLTINGLLYTAVTGARGTDDKFSVDGTDTDSATDLAAAITGDTRTGTKADTTATGSGAVVTITSTQSGDFGNLITLATADAGAATVSAATLTGGDERLFNLPYDGALTMAVTFTVNCQ